MKIYFQIIRLLYKEIKRLEELRKKTKDTKEKEHICELIHKYKQHTEELKTLTEPFIEQQELDYIKSVLRAYYYDVKSWQSAVTKSAPKLQSENPTEAIRQSIQRSFETWKISKMK